MKALVIGGGGREHALAWRLRESPSIERVYCSPGNAGIALDVSCIPADTGSRDELAALAALAETLGVAFTVVGPEAPLVEGVVDAFLARGLPIVGPSRAAARLEGSKIFTKRLLERHRIPTARAVAVSTVEELDDHIGGFGFPVALKADGLAAGKGVILAQTEDEARAAGRSLLSGEAVGEAGHSLLIEEFLMGREVSFIVLTDGERLFELRATQDHKAVYDGDRGPNTGGMGAYCDDSILDEADRQRVLDAIIEPTLAGMRADGHPFRGFLYCGLMMTADGPKVLEYNVRLGDPETQPLLYRLTGDFGELLASAARGALDGAGMGWRPGATTCVVMAAPGYPGAYEKGIEIGGFEAAELTGAKVFHAGTLLKAGRMVTSGGRVLGVTAAGDTLRASIERAYAAAERIRFPGAHYRRDIGGKGLARTRQ